jgi:hypothetical protein
LKFIKVSTKQNKNIENFERFKLTVKQNQSKITENMSEVAYIKTDSHFVNVHITSNCNSILTSERKFDKGITVQTLKDKLELITGARSALMTIEVFDQNDVKVCDLTVSIFSFLSSLILVYTKSNDIQCLKKSMI